MRNRFLLVNCDCPAFSYTEHAFHMMQIPHQVMKIEELMKNIDFNQYVVTSCVHHAQTVEKEVLRCNAKMLYVRLEQDVFEKYENISTLCVPFSQYELSHICLTLSAAFNRHDNHSTVLNELIGISPAIQRIKKVITQVATTDSNVLILGESGTGKEVIASCVHRLSTRKAKPFVPLNCGAIPSELMESELFGHEKGAFTGAATKRAGRFELANHGTLFLDEIGDMPVHMQVKLLRVIQDGKVSRIGSTSDIDVDVRIVAATNKKLEDLIVQNLFREDLYYRLNVIPIHVPPLRERKEDIPLLINYQLQSIQKRIPSQIVITESDIDVMCQHEWPGNIRELANFIERIVVLCQDKVLIHDDIVHEINELKNRREKSQLNQPIDDDHPFDLKNYLEKVEENLISAALGKANGVVNDAAQRLMLSRNTLVNKIKKYNLVPMGYE